jgi:hypothetical protein
LLAIWRESLPDATNAVDPQAFANWLCDLIVQPQTVKQIEPLSNLENYTLMYSLAFLARVRQGLTTLELCRRFEQHGLPYDLYVIRYLQHTPFICTSGDRLGLHSELLRLLQQHATRLAVLPRLEAASDVLCAD